MMKWVMALNVLGEDLELCDADPLTGFYRDGCRNTGADDVGVHVACAQMTDEFLEFSKANGNDLSTPHPDGGFAGLVAGDRWCVCASRWKDAFDAGIAPRWSWRRPTLRSSSGSNWANCVSTRRADRVAGYRGGRGFVGPNGQPFSGT